MVKKMKEKMERIAKSPSIIKRRASSAPNPGRSDENNVNAQNVRISQDSHTREKTKVARRKRKEMLQAALSQTRKKTTNLNNLVSRINKLLYIS